MSDGAPLGEVWETSWPESMGERDRVRAVAEPLEEPQSAIWISDRAAVDVETTREHLEQLDTIESIQGEARYQPDVEERHERFRSELSDKSTSDLLQLRDQIENDLEDWTGDDQFNEHRRQKREYLLSAVEDVLSGDC